MSIGSDPTQLAPRSLKPIDRADSLDATVVRLFRVVARLVEQLVALLFVWRLYERAEFDGWVCMIFVLAILGIVNLPRAMGGRSRDAGILTLASGYVKMALAGYLGGTGKI